MSEYRTFRLHNGIYGPVDVVTRPIGNEEDLVIRFLEAHTKLQINQIVAGIKNLGAHEIHEEARKKTTTRKVYQLVRNLREAGYPIVGDSNGIWIARSVHEVEEFANHLEEKARSDIKSMLHLKRTMLASVQSTTPSLFDAINLE